jgi:hypothetical protein
MPVGGQPVQRRLARVENLLVIVDAIGFGLRDVRGEVSVYGAAELIHDPTLSTPVLAVWTGQTAVSVGFLSGSEVIH